MVVGTLDGEPVDAVRNQVRIRPASTLLVGLQPIVLGVIEQRRHDPRIGLLRRRLEGAEVVAIPLGAVDELDMFQARGLRRHHFDQIAHHVEIERRLFCG